MADKIRIKIMSTDDRLVDATAAKVVNCAIKTKSFVSGPIPLKTETKDGKTFYKRIMDIYTNDKTVEALMKIDIPSSVQIEMKA